MFVLLKNLFTKKGKNSVYVSPFLISWFSFYFLPSAASTLSFDNSFVQKNQS